MHRFYLDRRESLGLDLAHPRTRWYILTEHSSEVSTSVKTPFGPGRRLLGYSAWVLLSFFSARAYADEVTLKNGDRLTGSVVKKDGKDLTVKTDQFGVVTTSWDQVASISTGKAINVVLQDGRTALGTLSTAGGQVTVATSTGNVRVALTDITAMRDADEQAAYERLLKPGWTQLWAGTAALGLAGTSGNAKTLTFTTAVNAARATNSDKTSLYFNTIKASALVDGKSADTAEAVRGGISYNRNLKPRLFANVFNDWEYDKFQSLDLRFVIGGGLGFHAIKTERSQLDLLGGGDYNHSSFSTPLIRNTGEIFWGDDYNLKLTSATSLVQSFRMFNDLSDTGMYRLNFDVGASTKIAKWLTWNVSLSDRYLSDPVPGRKSNDFLYTTGLGIMFAR